MKLILAIRYPVDSCRESENGMVWSFIIQISKKYKIIAITRKNNKSAIDRYNQDHPNHNYSNVESKYYDLPYWMPFWKKSSRGGAVLYFYLWHMFLPIWIKIKGFKFFIAHNRNLHNDCIRSFLWLFGKPFVYELIGHHPKKTESFLLKEYGWKVNFKTSTSSSHIGRGFLQAEVRECR